MAKRITAWSYSRYADYDKCPQLAKFKHVDRLKEPENDAMKRGSAVHKALSEALTNPDAQLPRDASQFLPLLTELTQLEPLVEQQWGFTNKWIPTGWYANDTWFRSVLDVCVVYDDHTADVVDFKTGKESPDHAKQAELYAISVFVRYKETANVTVRFWYLDHGTESVFRFSKNDAAELIKKWEKRVTPMLRDEIFAPKPGRHCQYCAFAKSKDGPCNFG